MSSNIRTRRWEEIARLAQAAGAQYPDLVAAQWALESGWGEHAPGNNYFGLKGPGKLLATAEVVDGKSVAIKDSFLEFDSVEDCIQYLVDRWYKDWKGHKGVNSASSKEAAARDLQKQGYATNPAYADKLIKLMKENAKAAGSAAPVAIAAVFRLVSQQTTALKKAPAQASTLQANEKREVPAGFELLVAELEELATEAHAQVKLTNGETWFIWQPHWTRTPSGGAQLNPVVKVNWHDFDSRVTPNLTVGEVLQWDRRRVPMPYTSVERRILKTALQFQSIRDAWGKPLSVTSFYRPEPINSQVGGVPGSRHVTGEAFDVFPAAGDLDGFYKWLRVRWTGGLGDGRSRGFVHCDIRNEGRFVPGAGVRPYVEWDY